MSEQVRVMIEGREVALSLEDAEALRKALWDQTYPLLKARREAAIEEARREGRLWVAVTYNYGARAEEAEEFLTRNEALGSLLGALDSDGGHPVRLVSPDGTVIEEDALDPLLANLYDESGNYREE